MRWCTLHLFERESLMTRSRHEIMHDALFWTSLAFCACGSLRNSEDKMLRGLWIDDLIPTDIKDTKDGVEVEGTAWISAVVPYRFVASVPQRMLHRRRERFSIEHLVIDEE